MDTDEFRELADKVFDINARDAVPAWRAMHKAADEIDHLRGVLDRIRRQAEPKEWHTRGHPMNRWVSRDGVLAALRDADR